VSPDFQVKLRSSRKLEATGRFTSPKSPGKQCFAFVIPRFVANAEVMAEVALGLGKRANRPVDFGTEATYRFRDISGVERLGSRRISFEMSLAQFESFLALASKMQA
jgi:hypothetical protein